MKIFRPVLGILVWLCFSVIVGQEIPKKLTIYSVGDGLSQSSVQSITQDIYGFIWISTGNGLNCFDGKNFTSYFPPFDSKSSYRANRMRKVLCDNIGNLWIGSDDGLFFFNRITNKIEDPFPEISKSMKGQCIPLLITEDTVHALLANCCVVSISNSDHQFKTISLGTSVFKIIQSGDDTNETWCVSWPSTLWFFNEKEGKLNIEKFNVSDLTLGDFADIKALKDNRYIVIFTDKIHLFDKESGKLSPAIETGIPFLNWKNNLRVVHAYESGEIWIGTSDQGILILDSLFHFKSQICNDQSQTPELPAIKNISLFYEDKEGNTWLGTDGSGLVLFNQGSPGFNLLNSESPTEGKLSSNFIRCFFEDEENDVWIGTYNEGINKWNRKTHKIETFFFDIKKSYPTPNDIYSMCPVSERELLIGTCTGLWTFDLLSNSARPLFTERNSYSIYITRSIIPAGKDHFITQMDNKVYMASKDHELWSLDPLPFPDSALINYVSYPKPGQMLAFSGSGIYQFMDNVVSFRPYSLHSEPLQMKINSLAKTETGSFYAATDKGLALLNLTGEVLKIYGTDDGLPNHYLYGILTDEKKNLWISSNMGISRFNPSNEKFNNFSIKEGLQSMEFNAGATYKNKKGEMFFGGINGFNYFHPDSLYASGLCPGIVISGIKVNDMVFLSDSGWMSKKNLNLEYEQNTVTFEFNDIEFSHPGFTTFSCYLEGYDKDWLVVGKAEYIRYSKLPPGKYIFRVKAMNRMGNWSRNIAQISLTIARPFWMEIWFIILAVAMFIGIISLTVYYLLTARIRKRLAILERQREISLVRSRISSDLHDDIGTGLSKLAMMNDTLITESGDDPDLSERLKKVSTNARRLIDQLRVIVWTLNPHYDHLESLISYLHQQAGDFLDNSPLKATFHLPAKIPPVTVTPEFKRNVHYTVMEALHNVIKHSGSREVSVNIEIKNNNLVISISDTGKGIDPERRAGFGNGLHFMKKRIEDINGELSIDSNANKGTTVKIRVGF